MRVRVLTIQSGVKLEYEHRGHRDSPLAVLISGAGAPAQFWHETFYESLLRNGFQYVRYSHRDTGWSTHFDVSYGMDALLDDLQCLIDEFPAPEVHLVGHAMGGYLALLAMDKMIRSIRSATVISCGPTVHVEDYEEFGMTAPSPEAWQALIENSPTGDLSHDLPGWMRSCRLLNGCLEFDELLALKYTVPLYSGDSRNWQVATSHIHALSTLPRDMPNRVGTIDTPVLVMHGDHDVLVPIDHGRALANRLGNGRFHAIEEAGHMFFNQGVWDEISEQIIGHVLGRGVEADFSEMFAYEKVKE